MSRLFLQQQSPGRPVAKVRLESEVLIGRDPDCTIALVGDDLASRHHARVTITGGKATLKDLGSTNGTTLAGAKVKEVALKVGQAFRVGHTTFTLQEEAEPAATKPATPKPGLFAKARSALSPVKVTEETNEQVFETRTTGTGPGVTSPPSLEQATRLAQRLAAVNRVGHALSSLLEVDPLLEEVVAQVAGLYPTADTCCVLVDEGGELRPAKVHRRRGDAGEIRLSKTVVRMNRYERKAVLAKDTALDRRLAKAESIVASGIQSVMSVPLLSQDEFLGILYLDTSDVMAPFSADDLELVASLAGQVSVFIKNARLVGQIRRETELRTNLGRYLSPSVVSEIASGHLNPSLGGEARDGTVLFSDIVGFTRLCRELSAAEVVALLNTFFQDLVDAVFRYDGTVDKFGGDAMLCVWGAPVASEDHAASAIAGALEMQNRLYGFNLDLLSAGSPVQVRMGIGLNSGRFIAGNVGSERRLEYTVIGDDVNLAQRVEEKATGGMVLVSDATRRLVPGAAAIRMQPIEIRGATGEFTVHSVRAVPIAKGLKDGALLASIPAKASLASEGGTIESQVVGFVPHASGVACTLRVPGFSGLDAAEALDVEFLLPEVPQTLRAVGKVLGARPPEERRPYRDLDVLFPMLPAPLDGILKAGSGWQSPLAPTSIRRE